MDSEHWTTYLLIIVGVWLFVDLVAWVMAKH
jgi:hypothetical protein